MRFGANEHRHGMRVGPEATDISIEIEQTNRSLICPRTPAQGHPGRCLRLSVSLLPSQGPPAGSGIAAVCRGPQLLAGRWGAQPKMCVLGLARGALRPWSAPSCVRDKKSQQRKSEPSLSLPQVHTPSAPLLDALPAGPVGSENATVATVTNRWGAGACSGEHEPVKGWGRRPLVSCVSLDLFLNLFELLFPHL